jgi:Ca2+-binding EF-hand superfamily protein
MTKTVVTVVAVLVVVGNLGAQEDAAAKRKAAQEKIAKMAEEQFKKLDKDGDGQLTLDEFKGRRAEGKMAEELFKILDKNEDGKVCIEEFKDKPPEFRFKMMDKDGDGVLTFEEFKGRREKPEDVEKAEQYFKRLDTNGDKKVCLEEFKAGQKKPARKPRERRKPKKEQ